MPISGSKLSDLPTMVRISRAGLAVWIGLLFAFASPMAAATQVASVSHALASSDARTSELLQSRLSAIRGLEGVVAQVADGVAQLDGNVLAPAQRKQAVDLATTTAGVASVENRIAIHASLGARFASAYEQMTGKLVNLLAGAPLLIIAVLIVLLAVLLGGVISRRLHWLRLRSPNPYMDGLARRVVQTVVVLIGVVTALDLLDATSLIGAVLGSAGVVGLVLGFAFKDIAENYIAGILLSLRRPFAPGDHVLIEGREGKVIALTSRATILMTMDGNHLQMPNSVVFKSVLLNYSRNPKRRFDFTTTVDVATSWNDALEVGVQTIAGIQGVLSDPAPSGQIKDLSNEGATLQFMGWIDQRENDLLKSRSEAMRLVRRKLRAAGIPPPEPVQRVQLVREPAAGLVGAEETEAGEQRDMSVDNAVDKQLDVARTTQEGGDLLTGSAAKPAE